MLDAEAKSLRKMLQGVKTLAKKSGSRIPLKEPLVDGPDIPKLTSSQLTQIKKC